MDAATSRVEVCGPAVAVMDFHLAQGTAMHVIAPVAESDRSLITIVLTNDATAIVREAAVEQEQTIFLQDRENQSGTRHHRGNRPQPQRVRN
jgi:ActR/RegA family two-component response regulator